MSLVKRDSPCLLLYKHLLHEWHSCLAISPRFPQTLTRSSLYRGTAEVVLGEGEAEGTLLLPGVCQLQRMAMTLARLWANKASAVPINLICLSSIKEGKQLQL